MVIHRPVCHLHYLEVSEHSSLPRSPGQELRGINNPAPLPELTAASHRLIKRSVLLLQEHSVKLMTYFFHTCIPVNERLSYLVKASHFIVEIMQQPS